MKTYLGVIVCSGFFDEAFTSSTIHDVVRRIVDKFRSGELREDDDEAAVSVLDDDSVEIVIPSVPKLFETEDGSFDWDNEEIWQELEKGNVP